MAIRRKKKKKTTKARRLKTGEPPQPTGPKLDIAASVCLGATMYTARQAVMETAIKRAKGVSPIPLAVVKIALVEHGLGWAMQEALEGETDE